MRNQRLRPDPPGSAPSSRTPNAATTKAKALAATAAALLLWASAFAAIRLALRSYGPAELALLRFAVASMVFGGCAMTVRPRLRLPERRAWTAMLGLGLLGLVIYHLALNAGERTTTAGSASLLVATAPLFTAVFAVWLDGQRLHGRQVLGLGVGFAGAALLAASGPGGLRLDVGAMLVLVAAASEAAYFVLQQRYLAVYRPLVVAASTTWAATALLLPAAPAALRSSSAGRRRRRLRRWSSWGCSRPLAPILHGAMRWHGSRRCTPPVRCTCCQSWRS